MRNGSHDERLEEVVRAWSSAFSEEVLEFAQPPEVNDTEVFADVYHSLIHSPLSETLLQLEAAYASSVEAVCRERDLKLADMEAKHTRDMAEALAAAGSARGYSEEEVGRLASHQLEERDLLTSRYESELATLHQAQHREFREWVMCVHEEYRTSNQRPAGLFPRSESSFSMSSQTEVSALQESFTITLGAQMKQMHNLRLVAANIMDLCKYSGGEESLPQRLQTSMSLYSNNLCGLVLLTDTRLSVTRGLTAQLQQLCQRATEFHFPSLETQLETVKADLKRANSWRTEFWHKKAELEARLGGGAPPGPAGEPGVKREGLQTGDFYLTKHSNLCETHVVFHLVADEQLDANGNMSSRHPIIIGMRNVLKTACLNDITTLTIPLLLAHGMTENMTVAWCLKRAELMFKCIKGFMMEMSGWGGTEIKTLQFLVPLDINEEVFIKLTGLLSSIFRIANPIRGT